MAATILIADDDAVQRRLVENMVQKCGYETVVVDSGDAAMAMLTAPDTPPIDALVLDLVMPGVDGYELLDLMRADPRHARTRVVVFTAHTEGLDLRRLVGRGVIEVVSKDEDTAQVVARLLAQE